MDRHPIAANGFPIRFTGVLMDTWIFFLFVAIAGLGRFNPVFSMEQERKLVSYLKEMEIILHGVSPYELRVLAFQLAEKNGIDHPFSEGLAGQDWLRGFLKRHPDIALRKPQATSAARAKGFNKIAVDKFYDLLGATIEKYDLTPNRIFNVDETGCIAVPKHTVTQTIDQVFEEKEK